MSVFDYIQKPPTMALTRSNIKDIKEIAKLADDIWEVSSPNEIAPINSQQCQDIKILQLLVKSQIALYEAVAKLTLEVNEIKR
ncbi:hypothetical protein GQX74_000170 [Glossina fuscipes]|nr:hypothetical protein GQX74_000170 [Glossina fuscipes]